jgi:hypothetical protein
LFYGVVSYRQGFILWLGRYLQRFISHWGKSYSGALHIGEKVTVVHFIMELHVLIDAFGKLRS